MQTLLTPAVLAAQEHYYGRRGAVAPAPTHDPLTDDERGFIETRDSFYMATISQSGWPYIQHRGGLPGFLRVVDAARLAFADYRGNRQLLSTGNLATNDRVSLFLMDYPRRTRLKVLGHARVEDAKLHPELVARFAETQVHQFVERVFFIDVLSYDWNCPKYITPRYTAAELEGSVASLKRRIEEREAQVERR
jgi:predicted pyridoxine 5'-phosphate oxidase superfamily flavin-nucleotide-binding protein